jgi:hypothetical protein
MPPTRMPSAAMMLETIERLLDNRIHDQTACAHGHNPLRFAGAASYVGAFWVCPHTRKFGSAGQFYQNTDSVAGVSQNSTSSNKCKYVDVGGQADVHTDSAWKFVRSNSRPHNGAPENSTDACDLQSIVCDVDGQVLAVNLSGRFGEWTAHVQSGVLNRLRGTPIAVRTYPQTSISGHPNLHCAKCRH